VKYGNLPLLAQSFKPGALMGFSTANKSLLVPVEKNLFGCLVYIRYAAFLQLTRAYSQQIEKLHDIGKKIDIVVDHQLW
jgi:hypothetical protein